MDHTPRDADISRQLREMNEYIEAFYNQALTQDDGFNTGPPFSVRIMQETLPSNFILPQLKNYDGTFDLMDHLGSFKSFMMFHRAFDATICRAFPTTPKGIARQWFLSLKPQTIHSFYQMSHLFIGHFISSRRQWKGSDSLINIKQKEGESL